jgi:biotin transport system substrate-specific component
LTSVAVIADRVVSRSWLASTIMVLSGTALVALAAQLAVPMYPVPMTMQTFAVLLVGAVIGAGRAAVSMSLYLAIGAAGLPVFAGAQNLTGVLPTAGYLVGFVAAAAIVGLLARLGWSSSPLRVAASFAAGSIVIYGFGVIGLMLALGLTLTTALSVGVLPFLIGDAAKAALAAVILPAAWKLVR